MRLTTLAEAFGWAGQLASLCDQYPLSILAGFDPDPFGEVTIANPCIQGEPVDADPARAGTQPSCQLSWFVDYRGPDQVETPLAPCSAVSGLPCWRAIDDPNCTDYPSGISLEVVTEQPWPRRSTVVAQCLVE